MFNHTVLWEKVSKRTVFLFAFFTSILGYSQHYESVAIVSQVATGTAQDRLYEANLFLTTAPATAIPIRVRARLVSGGTGTFTANGDNLVFTSNNTGGAANGSVIEFTILTVTSTIAAPVLYTAQDIRFAITDLDGPTNEAIFANCSTGPKFMAVSKSPVSNLTVTTAGGLLRVDGTANQNSEVTSTVIYEYQKKNTFTFTSFGNNGFLKEFDLNYNNFQIANPQYYTCALDSDGDAVGNVVDVDDDNDGIADVVESGGNNPNGDADGDGLPNYLDTTNNLGTDPSYLGDGSTTSYLDSDNNGIPNVYDFDADGIPNHMDTDSDGDGCSDAIEGSEVVKYNHVYPLNFATVALRGQIKVLGNGVTSGTPSQVISTVAAANGVPLLVNNAANNTGGVAGIADNTDSTADIGQGIGTSQNSGVRDTECDRCFRPSTTPGIGGLATNHGVTALSRAGANNGNWPMKITGAYTALDAKTKGFVINRLTTSQVNAITNPVVGMMVYDTTVNCLKIYDNTSVWRCFSTQTCDNFNQ